MIFMTPHGGHGTVFLSKKINLRVRPDVVFGIYPIIKLKPDPLCAKQWRGRSGRKLDPDKTIEENLVDMITYCNKNKIHVLLSGRCSINNKFLTDNNIEATCIIRHPLHAYISFMKNQHPEYAAPFGGFNTKDSVKWWAQIWMNITSDIMESVIKKDSIVYKFEEMPDSIKDPWLKERLAGWDPSKRNNGILDPELENTLFQLVKFHFFYFYKKWDI